MSGFNQNLKPEDKIRCLYCLSNKKPILEQNKLVCVDCKAHLQTFSFINVEGAKKQTSNSKN